MWWEVGGTTGGVCDLERGSCSVGGGGADGRLWY